MRRLLPLLLPALLAPTAHAQQSSLADLLADRVGLTWIGVDYSATKFTPRYKFGPLDQAGPAFFERWNMLFEGELDKYTPCPHLKVKDCTVATSYVEPVNREVKVPEVWNKPELAPEGVQELVSRYRTEDRSGVGMVYIAIKYDAPAERADYYVTFFDMATRQVLHTEKVSAEPGGAGLRNYWASTVIKVHEQLKGIRKKLH
ncbi:MAG: hypothetical protein IT228_11780 [Flavobacteriales bacterium]|nr:hypothetical protein [Flavobacteriales bacterium]MCC6578013.1 hypothetical protein [Flavobacteriales bacterium]